LSELAPISVEEGIPKTLWENRSLKSVKTIGRRSRQVQKPVLAQEWTDNYKGKLPEAYEKLTNCVGIACDHKHLRKRKRSSSPIGLEDYYFMKEKQWITWISFNISILRCLAPVPSSC